MTHMTGVTDGEPCEVETRNGTVRARDVIVAAHVPANNWAALITKLPAYRTYAIGARGGAADPARAVLGHRRPVSLHAHAADAEGEVLIIGGEDHKTGTETETLQHFESLLDYARSHFGVEQAEYRWSGQIIEPVDGLPFIGLNTASDARLRGDRVLGQRHDVGDGRGPADERSGARAAEPLRRAVQGDAREAAGGREGLHHREHRFPEVPGARSHDQRRRPGRQSRAGGEGHGTR